MRLPSTRKLWKTEVLWQMLLILILLSHFDEYDLDEANQEVDDFLAGLSDDDEEEEEEEEDEEIENPESNNDDEEIYEQSTNGHDSFIKDAYSKKRNRDEEEVQLVKKQK